MPSALAHDYLALNLTQLLAADNPYFVELGTGVTGNDGSAIINLEPDFDTVQREWLDSFGPPTQNVSLQVDVTYLTESAGMARLFHAYSQVAFNPAVTPDLLNASFVLNLSDPTWIGNLPQVHSGSSPQPCQAMFTTHWSTDSFSIQRGVLPLALAVDNASASGQDLVKVSDVWGTYPTATLGLGGVQAGFPGVVEASPVPSWTGSYPNFFDQAAVGTSSPVPPANQSMDVPSIYFTGVTYAIVVQQETVDWHGGSACAAMNAEFHYVTLSVPLADTGLPRCTSTGCFEIFLASTEIPGPGLALENLPGRMPLSEKGLGSGAEVNMSTLLGGLTNYTEFLGLEASVADTTMVFTTNLGESVLVSDLLSGCDGFCAGNTSTSAESTLAAQFGPAVSELASLGAIGYVLASGASSNPVAQQVVYSNVPVGSGNLFDLYLSGGSAPMYLSIDGNLVGLHTPDLGPLVCASGAMPGNGC